MDTERIMKKITPIMISASDTISNQNQLIKSDLAIIKEVIVTDEAKAHKSKV